MPYHMNHPCHTYEWVTSHSWTSQVTPQGLVIWWRNRSVASSKSNVEKKTGIAVSLCTHLQKPKYEHIHTDIDIDIDIDKDTDTDTNIDTDTDKDTKASHLKHTHTQIHTHTPTHTHTPLHTRKKHKVRQNTREGNHIYPYSLFPTPLAHHTPPLLLVLYLSLYSDMYTSTLACPLTHLHSCYEQGIY